MKPKLYIRPVYVIEGDRERQVSLALARVPGEITQDSDIAGHYDIETNGVEISEIALEFFNATTEWGRVIYA
jgi:hypothetical protein